MKGHFIISLDYEIHWGVFDKKSVQDYHENLSSVNFVIDRLLELSNRYDVKLTFSTVGLLFAENKEDLILHSPKQKPPTAIENLILTISFRILVIAKEMILFIMRFQVFKKLKILKTMN